MTDSSGSHFEWITVTPSVQAAAYADGELLTEKLVFTSPLLRGESALKFSNGVIEAVVILDNAARSVALDLVLFDVDPADTTFTENAPFAPADADLHNSIGAVSVKTYTEFFANTMATKTVAGIQFDPANVTTIYGALVTRGKPVYVAPTDLTVRIGVRYNNP